MRRTLNSELCIKEVALEILARPARRRSTVAVRHGCTAMLRKLGEKTTDFGQNDF